MPFNTEVREEALVRSARHCCLCHRFCGLKIELHHIVQEHEGGGNTLENCIPLCFDCHADIRSYDHKHPKGSKYTPGELRRRRDLWFQKVANSTVLGASEAHPADVKVYQWITEVLPWSGAIQWLANTDLAGAFRTDTYRNFQQFAHKSADPHKEFFDPDLEGCRADLVGRINEMLDLIAPHLFNAKKGDDWLLKIAPERRYQDDAGFHRLMTKVHVAADSVVAAYRALIRAAELRLSAKPS